MSITKIEDQIFQVNPENFNQLTQSIAAHQLISCGIYNQYANALGYVLHPDQHISDHCFLPIQFFKSHRVTDEEVNTHDCCFESSGTTGQQTSKHYVRDLAIYEQSFRMGFSQVFGDVRNYCMLGLLPSYLERGNSSLVYMTDRLIRDSGHSHSGFYLHDTARLHENLSQLEAKKQAVILIGVTYALLDFAEIFPMTLNHTTIIETGGMKGRREELVREQVHAKLKTAFSVDSIASEYGMTELLSQAYSLQDGRFKPAPWMKVLVRDLYDPLQVSETGKGALNIIDLANVHSCSFIATEDMGEVFDDGTFTVIGRMQQSELRGCSLMIA